MTIPSSRSLNFEVKSTGSELAFIRVLRLGLDTLPSADFGRLWKTSDFFRNLQKWSCHLQKSQHFQDKNLMLISQKKLAGPGLEKCESWEFPFFSRGMWSIGRECRPWKWCHDGTIWQFPYMFYTQEHIYQNQQADISLQCSFWNTKGKITCNEIWNHPINYLFMTKGLV